MAIMSFEAWDHCVQEHGVDPDHGPSDYGDVTAEYGRLREDVGMVEFSGRTKIEMTGSDRVRFLHNLCTNDIQSLQVGYGCEAFVTSIQARIVGHVLVFATKDSLVINTVPAQYEKLSAHLDHFRIIDDIQFHDRTQEWNEVLLSGPRAQAVLRELSYWPEDWSEPSLLEHQEIQIGTVNGWLRKVEFTGCDDYLLSSPERRPLVESLLKAGVNPVGTDAFEALRLEAGYALYGPDISEANFPQEIGRDGSTISFSKGCYLGQETVARLDAYGHVNKHLVSLTIDGEVCPEMSAPLFREDKEVGRLTSVAYSPEKGIVALGYVSRGNHEQNTKIRVGSLESEVCTATVMAPPSLSE